MSRRMRVLTLTVLLLTWEVTPDWWWGPATGSALAAQWNVVLDL